MRGLLCGVDFCGWTFATWLGIRLLPCIRLAMVLYLCTSGMLHVIPSYGCVSGEQVFVSSGMTWGLVCVGCRLSCPGFMVTFSFPLTFSRVPGTRGTVVVGCYVILRGYGCYGISTLGSCAEGGGASDCGTAVFNMIMVA